MGQAVVQTRREAVGRYFLRLVRMKIVGLITQAELEILTRNHPFDEQLSMNWGIGASTEVREE